MLDLLKKVALEKMQEQFAPNSLDEQNTQRASEEGANAFMDVIQNQLKGGNLSALMGLMNGKEQNWQNNPMVQELIGKVGNVLQNKGLNAQEAQQNAAQAAPAVLNSLKDKFLSQDEADKDFDLSALEGLMGGKQGGLGGLLGQAGKLFGK